MLGDAAHTDWERNQHFGLEVRLVRQALAHMKQGGKDAEPFWTQYMVTCAAKDADPRFARSGKDHILPARVAALMQVLATEEEEVRSGLVRYLASLAHVEATRALARLALFAPEDKVRRLAVEGLQVRREADYTDILLAGFRYPWPAVARRASEAVAALGRADLTPRLVEILKEPDPRLPVVQVAPGKRVSVVCELVRINHHRNCLLCHAPIHDPEATTNFPAVTGAVPVPDQPLPSPSETYVGTAPGLLVRADLAYLRQDFSLMQDVPEAWTTSRWPRTQRFEFLVRTRALAPEEAQSYRTRLDKAGPSPYRQAVAAALRGLKGPEAIGLPLVEKQPGPTRPAEQRKDQLPQAEADQKALGNVENVLRCARAIGRTDSMVGHALLKWELDYVRDNLQLSERVRRRLVERLKQRLEESPEIVFTDRTPGPGLRDILDGMCEFAGYDDPKMTLAQALDDLRKQHGIAIKVNEQAFELEDVENVLKTRIADPVSLPPLARVSVNTVLKRILARVPALSGVTLVQRGEGIEITTGRFARAGFEPWDYFVSPKTPLDKLLPHPPGPSARGAPARRRPGTGSRGRTPGLPETPHESQSRAATAGSANGSDSPSQRKKEGRLSRCAAGVPA